jgi:hypothetical protein
MTQSPRRKMVPESGALAYKRADPRPVVYRVRLDDLSQPRATDGILYILASANAHLNRISSLLTGMSSPKRPSSQVSTRTATPETALPHSIDEKHDPWLVSFGPEDPENPLVYCAFLLVPYSSAFLNALI